MYLVPAPPDAPRPPATNTPRSPRFTEQRPLLGQGRSGPTVQPEHITIIAALVARKTRFVVVILQFFYIKAHRAFTWTQCDLLQELVIWNAIIFSSPLSLSISEEFKNSVEMPPAIHKVPSGSVAATAEYLLWVMLKSLVHFPCSPSSGSYWKHWLRSLWSIFFPPHSLRWPLFKLKVNFSMCSVGKGKKQSLSLEKDGRENRTFLDSHNTADDALKRYITWAHHLPDGNFRWRYLGHLHISPGFLAPDTPTLQDETSIRRFRYISPLLLHTEFCPYFGKILSC